VDADTGQIIAAELTSKDVDDGSQVGPLLGQIAGPVASFTGDGAYDRDDVYREVCQRKEMIMPGIMSEGSDAGSVARCAGTATNPISAPR
jgi:hypothetical protein